MKLPKFNISRRGQITALVLAGLFVGIGCYFAYTLRAHSYLGNDSSACVNCHIMAPYYATWQHSSHSRNATCNDCHVPNNNPLAKYAFKAADGVGHMLAFISRQDEDVIMAKDGSAEVIMDNCIRCHTQLNQEGVKTGRIDFMATKRGEGKACWDCHRNVPHGNNSKASTPSAIIPYPESPAPEWLNKALK